jgi:hypothetical protein
MQLNRWHRLAGVLLGMAMLWAVAGSLRSALNPFALFYGSPKAAPPNTPAKPDNPCNPNAGAAKTDNPCNPNAGAQASNPCNPNAGAAKTDNPCNPNAGVQAGNPCNPNAGAQASNPCNPNAGGAPAAAAVRVGLQSNGAKIDWGRDFKTWDAVTGYVLSNSHGNRLVQTYIDPPEAVRVYKHNAELARLRKTAGFLPYPAGTRIVQESWLRNDVGGPGAPGPVFFMRKEDAGYDPAGGNWHYGFTRNDLALIGEGHEGKMEFCKACHARANQRDHVYATER